MVDVRSVAIGHLIVNVARHLLFLQSALSLMVAGSPVSGQLNVVLLSHRVTNVGDVEAVQVQAHCLLPVTNRYQHVAGLKVHPQPLSTQIDGESQQAVTVSWESIPPGRSRSIRVVVWVRPKATTVFNGCAGRQLVHVPRGRAHR